MTSLKDPYISVAAEGGESYGGRQQSSGDAVISRCGCGVIAAADTLLYMCRRHEGCHIPELAELSGETPLDRDRYYDFVKALNRRYFPLLPPFGMNGLTLMCGMDRFFSRHSMPYAARWGISREKLWDRLAEMLSSDIPAILSVGPNFPLFWRGTQLSLYRPGGDGRYYKAAAAKGHYVVATGLDKDRICISSWGQRYYLDRLEYQRYADESSTSVLSNLLYIYRK